MNAIALFRHTTPSELLGKSVTLRTSESGARRLGLLPASSKSGPSLKSISGLKGQALKKFKRERAAELKVAMSREFAGLAADPAFVGRSVTVSKTGVLGFFLEPCDAPAADATALTEAEAKIKELEAKLAALNSN